MLSFGDSLIEDEVVGLTCLGQLGHGPEMTECYTPRRIQSMANRKVLAAACGREHCCLLSDKGDIYWFGNTECSNAGQNVPRLLSADWGMRIVGIAASDVVLFFCDSDGRAWKLECNPGVDPQPLPIDIGQEHALYVAAGGSGALVITQEGSLHTCSSDWGSPRRRGPCSGLMCWYKVGDLPACGKLVTGAVGDHHALLLTGQGEVLSAGHEFEVGCHNALGHGSDHETYCPRSFQVIEALRGKVAVQVVCGAAYSLVLMDCGTLYSFGGYPWSDEECPELGRGYILPDSTPQPVLEWYSLEGPMQLERVTTVGGGTNHCFCKTETGKLLAWGHNTDAMGLGPASQLSSMLMHAASRHNPQNHASFYEQIGESPYCRLELYRPFLVTIQVPLRL